MYTTKFKSTKRCKATSKKIQETKIYWMTSESRKDKITYLIPE